MMKNQTTQFFKWANFNNHFTKKDTWINSNTLKVAQYHKSIGKCILKPQWNHHLCLKEWLKFKRFKVQLLVRT